MDKETLSNYGWIVICVLVLAVMIALATPFGNFVSVGVQNTTQGLFSLNDSAMSVVGIDIGDNKFVETPYDHSAPALHPNNGSTPVNGDTYNVEDNDYTYQYQSAMNGWWARVKTEKVGATTLGPIYETINGKPIVILGSAFRGCTALKVAPAIPETTVVMSGTFLNCSSLVTPPEIPNSVVNMTNAFQGCSSLKSMPTLPSNLNTVVSICYGCTSLETPPNIPEGITSMDNSFNGCTALKTAPVIPNSVITLGSTFANCTSLEAMPTIPSGCTTTVDRIFKGCTQFGY